MCAQRQRDRSLLGDNSWGNWAIAPPQTVDTDTSDRAHRRPAITAGYVHSCALNDDGTAPCWGDNSWNWPMAHHQPVGPDTGVGLRPG
nr:RCC1 domain-containing protein [Candidatus Microthrix sp.]